MPRAMVATFGPKREDPPMAKRSKKKAKARRGTFGEAMKALEAVGSRHREVGKLNTAGNAEIDIDELQKLKKDLGKAASKVKFVALNAPFKRRLPIPPT